MKKLIKTITVSSSEECLFDQWYNDKVKNLNEFTLLLFKSFIAADGSNKAKIKTTWPEWFKDIQSF